jgi:hypothetical protein
MYFDKPHSYYANREALELIPAVVRCKERILAFQLTSNEFISKELIPILAGKFGTGELRNPHNEESSFELFYAGEKIQKWIGDYTKILEYDPIDVPLRLKKYSFFQHLDYR